MRITAILTIAAIITAFSSCVNPKGQNQKDSSNSRPRIVAKEPDNSQEYTHVKFDFYSSKTGQLCERKLVCAIDNDSACNCDFIVKYDSVFKIFRSDSLYEIQLGLIIDIKSFEHVYSIEYSKDKYRVYYFHPNSDGGVRQIVEGADPTTFRSLDYRWGIDERHVFYEDRKLEGLNLSKLQIIYSPDTSDSFIQYVKDDHIVFEEGEILQGADASTFKVVSGKEWAAEDKNFKYESGGRKIKK
jgi:hypothetical protein